jgi:hypothetical protein
MILGHYSLESMKQNISDLTHDTSHLIVQNEPVQNVSDMDTKK